MPAPKKVLVIGGGVIGLSAACALAGRQHQVTLLERGRPDHDSCSRGNAGMIVPSHFVPLAAPGAFAQALRWMWNPGSPLYIKPRLDLDLFRWGWRFLRSATADHVRRSAPLLRDLSLASRALFEEQAASGGDFGLVRKGLLMLCRTPHGFHEESRTAAAARELGVPAEILDAAQVRRLEPGVTMDVAGAVLFPKDCHLEPHRYLAHLTRRFQEQGGTVQWETEVTGWKTGPQGVAGVQTRHGLLEADDYVLAGGSWSPLVARDLGLALPMQAGKGYSLTVPQPRQLPTLCAIFTEARVAVTPMGSSLRFGGTMEIAGLDETITPRRVQGIVDAVPKYYPEFRPEDFSGLQPWRGLRPVTPDGMPYLGRPSGYANLIVATGHAMMGLSLAPVTGQIVARLASGEAPGFPLELLRPERFG